MIIEKSVESTRENACVYN